MAEKKQQAPPSAAGAIAGAVASAFSSVSGIFVAKEKTAQTQTIVGGEIVKAQIGAQLQVDLGEQQISNNLYGGIMGIREQAIDIKQRNVEQKQFEKNQAFYAGIFVVIVLAVIYTITLFKK